VSSSLWNAVESLMVAWARDLEESLETDTQPDWEALVGDLSAAMTMVSILAERERQRVRASAEPVA
jgi:hypothetical protein